jgi:tetratricopeptide (TPR) repeat protein
MDEFLSADRSSSYYNEGSQASIYYAQCWALTHLLMIGDPKKATALFELLKQLDQGEEETVALRRALGDPKALGKELSDYISQSRFQGRVTKATLQETSARAWTLTPAEVLALKADFLVHTGALAEARPLLAQAMQLDPDLGLVHEVMGQLLWRQGKGAEASRAFVRATQLSPGNYLAQYYRAVAARSGGGETEAAEEQALLRSLELNPDFPLALARLSELYRDEGRNLEQALTLAQKVQSLEPTRVDHALLVASVLARMGRAEEAAKGEQEVFRLSRVSTDHLMPAVGYLRRNHRDAEADELLRKAVEAQPANAQAVEMLATSLARQKRPEEAEALLRRALEQRPRDLNLLNSLAYSYADRGVRLDEALALITKCLEHAPDVPSLQAAFLDTKAWTLFRLNRLEEAERIQRKALALQEDPVILDHMGDILQRRGAAREAVGQWQKALARETDPERKAAIEAKVKVASSS